MKPGDQSRLLRRSPAVDNTLASDTPASPNEPSSPAVGSWPVLEHYEITTLIGVGGMGLVYVGRAKTSGRSVAIKMLRPELVSSAEAAHRFWKEARHMRRLAHSRVLPILEISESRQGPFLIMPFVEGGSLAGLLESKQPLPHDLVLKLVRQIAEALDHAHRHGVIHGDVKPANVLLDADGNVLLADFGLARSLFNDSMLDLPGAACAGTLPYLSPAVAAGEVEDTRRDIYALGALLYQMLTGQPPYLGSPDEIRRFILADPPRPILDLNPAAHLGLAAIAAKAMARDQRDRYVNMSALLADLNLVENGRSPSGGVSPRELKRKQTLRLILLGCTLTIGLVLLTNIRSHHWKQMSSLPSPPGRANAAMVWDSTRQEAVLFGGGFHDSAWHQLGETWIWRNGQWRTITTASNPSPRRAHSMAFDTTRGRAVLYGGQLDSGGGRGSYETWEWDGTNWTQLFPQTRPEATEQAPMVFHEARGECVLFGGFTAPGGDYQNETWTWNGQQWLRQNPRHRPTKVIYHTMAYDRTRQRVVLFGGYRLGETPYNETWEWDGTNWERKDPENSPRPPRGSHAMAYAAPLGGCVLFGGGRKENPLSEFETPLADLWVWNGANWTKVSAISAPPARYNHTLVFDEQSNRLLLYGGTDGSTYLSDTWVLGD